LKINQTNEQAKQIYLGKITSKCQNIWEFLTIDCCFRSLPQPETKWLPPPSFGAQASYFAPWWRLYAHPPELCKKGGGVYGWRGVHAFFISNARIFGYFGKVWSVLQEIIWKV